MAAMHKYSCKYNVGNDMKKKEKEMSDGIREGVSGGIREMAFKIFSQP